MRRSFCRTKIRRRPLSIPPAQSFCMGGAHIACGELGSSLVITPESDEDACKVCFKSSSFVRIFSFSHDQILSFRIARSEIWNSPLGFSFHTHCIDALSLRKDQEGVYSLSRIGAVLLHMYKEAISVHTEKHWCMTMADGAPIMGHPLSSLSPFSAGLFKKGLQSIHDIASSSVGMPHMQAKSVHTGYNFLTVPCKEDHDHPGWMNPWRLTPLLSGRYF